MSVLTAPARQVRTSSSFSFFRFSYVGNSGTATWALWCLASKLSIGSRCRSRRQAGYLCASAKVSRQFSSPCRRRSGYPQAAGARGHGGCARDLVNGEDARHVAWAPRASSMILRAVVEIASRCCSARCASLRNVEGRSKRALLASRDQSNRGFESAILSALQSAMLRSFWRIHQIPARRVAGGHGTRERAPRGCPPRNRRRKSLLAIVAVHFAPPPRIESW